MSSPAAFARRYLRALGYARVSSEQQALGSSLKDQQDAITAGAKSFGLKVAVADMHVEAVSSMREKIETRAQIGILLGKVRKGDLIIVDKVDRWSRDPEFTYKSIREIKEKGANVYFVGEGIDAATDDGDTQLNFRILFAAEERKRIKLRMVGTRRNLRDRGHWVEGRPPLGYRLPVDGEEKHLLVVVKDDAALVRRVFKLAIEGKGAIATSDALGLPVQRIRTVLQSGQLYLGELKDSQGRWMKGRHAAILDVATVERTQHAVRARVAGSGPKGGATGARTDSWLLRDVARCAHCGGKMSARYSGNRDSPLGIVHYYACYRSGHMFRIHARNRQVALDMPTPWAGLKRKMAEACGHNGGVRVDAVEATVAPLVEARLCELRDELLAIGTRKQKPATSDDEAADVSALLVRLASKRERLSDAFGDGTMTKPDYARAIAKVENDEIALHDRARKLARPPALATPASRLVFLKRVETLLVRWRNGKPAQRRQLVTELVRRVAMSKGGEPVVTWFTAAELSAEG